MNIEKKHRWDIQDAGGRRQPLDWQRRVKMTLPPWQAQLGGWQSHSPSLNTPALLPFTLPSRKTFGQVQCLCSLTYCSIWESDFDTCLKLYKNSSLTFFFFSRKSKEANENEGTDDSNPVMEKTDSMEAFLFAMSKSRNMTNHIVTIINYKLMK